ncbi:hypothetical protein J6TS7_38260 [Paenibacillus dendritiformis]|uniref:type II secretion system F family protein n=1 Tax=Paenibacillus TaxID=44249 RepID=UPI001B120F26|nr:hypothetical protein [Paenibacillus dendritiformis]GIO80216.1 hypothetical protein J6TS7_38260 [Paenibacillus dendritiformis]
MITSLLLIISGLLMALSLFTLLPNPSSGINRDQEKILKMLGYVSARDKAKAIGWNLKWKHYLFLIMISVLAGYLISVYTGNYLFIVVGGGVCFTVPRFIVNKVQQKRRKELLIDLPKNVRLLVSKLRDCKTVVLSLKHSLPIMNGPSKPIFEEIYQSLVIGRSLNTALLEVQSKVAYQKFDDLCDKLITGEIEGFHTKAVENIRHTIADMTFDVEVIQEIDLKNSRSRLGSLVFVGMTLLFPPIFGYMESQMTVRTLDTPLGQFLYLGMFIIGVFTILARDKYLRLNLSKL